MYFVAKCIARFFIQLLYRVFCDFIFALSEAAVSLFRIFFSKLSKVKFLVSDSLNKGGGNRTKMDLLF